MQQAVFLDIALFAPALIASLGYGLVNQLTGWTLPAAAAEFGSDAVFVGLLLAVGYAAVSSLLGEAPNKIPFLSERVENRMITADMFDEQGRFQPFDEDGNLKRPKKDKKEDDTSSN